MTVVQVVETRTLEKTTLFRLKPNIDSEDEMIERLVNQSVSGPLLRPWAPHPFGESLSSPWNQAPLDFYPFGIEDNALPAHGKRHSHSALISYKPYSTS
jgi:hypothetical protein